MLARIKTLAEHHLDFALETTLAGKSYVPWLRKLKTSGYQIHMYFLWLPDVQICINRVADRVRHGGHHIPEPVIRRRWAAGISNLFHIYRPLLDSWVLFDNSLKSPYLIAQETAQNLVVLDTLKFASCFKMPLKPTDETLRESADQPNWMSALAALRLAKLDVIEQHCRSGHPIIIWRDGKVYHQPPEEAKRKMEKVMKNPDWLRLP